MVCNRCIAVVRHEFENLGLKTISVTLGEVDLVRALSPEQLELINSKLVTHGFEMMDDKKSMLIEKIKNVIISQIHYESMNDLKLNFSEIITGKLNRDYTYLTNLFSETEGITIERYIILQKIEKVKEMLVYDEMSLTEIADEMGYSSVAHLSTQFKKMTGFTTGYFKSIRDKKRLSLDNVKPVNDNKRINNSVTRNNS